MSCLSQPVLVADPPYRGGPLCVTQQRPVLTHVLPVKPSLLVARACRATPPGGA